MTEEVRHSYPTAKREDDPMTTNKTTCLECSHADDSYCNYFGETVTLTLLCTAKDKVINDG